MRTLKFLFLFLLLAGAGNFAFAGLINSQKKSDDKEISHKAPRKINPVHSMVFGLPNKVKDVNDAVDDPRNLATLRGQFALKSSFFYQQANDPNRVKKGIGLGGVGLAGTVASIAAKSALERKMRNRIRAGEKINKSVLRSKNA